MSNPSRDAVESIRSRVKDWKASDAEIADALNSPAIDNPDAAPTLPMPFGFVDVFACLSPASIAAVRGLPALPAIIAAINATDRAGLGHWVAALLAPPSLITPAEAVAIREILEATVPDPDWPARLSWAAVHLGRPVDPEDIAASRPDGE